tara:strand:- start:2445 stop:2798 length:354 start_codon:yes stop_codon:yes gene_type:complete
MASTRNNNTPGNYQAEQISLKHDAEYKVYENYGKPKEVCLPGNFILSGRMASENLSHNSVDIESSLFGINSTNLVKPAAPVNPEIKMLPSLNMADKKPVIVMEPTPANVTHKPLYLN